MRILSVVDEESAAMVMMLERKLRARVDAAPGFASAREFLSSDSNVLVTLDYQFPDRNGKGDTGGRGEERCRFLTPLLIS